MPYFRHKDKSECPYEYEESETNEHIKGKIDLFNWIKNQHGVTGAVLEAWLPETKQRPDVMFTYNNQLYVIEYQCSPISTEYAERHELYMAAGINDIWICGIEKYLQPNMREKYIQRFAEAFYDPENKILISTSNCSDYYYYRFKNKKLYSHSKDAFWGVELHMFTFDKKIYNKYIGKSFLDFRSKIQERIANRLIDEREPNYYLDKQNEINLNKLKEKLEKLSNNNWKFYIKYKSIYAEPIVYGIWRLNDINHTKLYLNNNLIREMIKDDNCLKEKLLPIMRHNRQQYLDYEHPYFRIMEEVYE